MIVGIFLSWVGFVGHDMTGWDMLTDYDDPDGAKQVMLKYAAVPLLIAGILTLVIFITNFIDSVKMPKFVPMISLIVTILALIFSIGALLGIKDMDDALLGSLDYGAGIFLCLVGTILAIIGPILALIKRENPVAAYESSFDSAASAVSSDDKE